MNESKYANEDAFLSKGKLDETLHHWTSLSSSTTPDVITTAVHRLTTKQKAEATSKSPKPSEIHSKALHT